ncbi:MAG TPA: transglycosylase SLT domain-containing protein [Mucilaginibacter sp.]|nr:transglycosylase SLT domain-containing protein [Mucilaginibacter sp.]
MKKLLIVVFAVFCLQSARANASFLADSSRSASRVKALDVLQRDGVAEDAVAPAHASHAKYQGNVYERRLDSIQKDVPLDYNEYVQNYIDTYLSQRGDMARMVGLSRYYFPIYEKIFHEQGIPEEIKYLSIVESRLNPYAVSRVGATGLWQFMSNTAQLYGLSMDNYVDQRRDPVQSTYAAAAYLKDAYEQFGDWLLAIASYNCGKSNVMHAIDLAGSNNFWAIRQYLPAETREYVPQYIAVAYVMNYYKRYGIVPQPCDFPVNNDTVFVDKHILLSNVSEALGMDISQITVLNPSYRMEVLNGSPASPQKLVLPRVAWSKYKALYNVLNSTQDEDSQQADPVININLSKVDDSATGDANPAIHHKAGPGSYISYRVQPGDTLPEIASKFSGVSVDDIKEMNRLKGSELQPGMMLMINKD